jgi:hypothetical protein
LSRAGAGWSRLAGMNLDRSLTRQSDNGHSTTPPALPPAPDARFDSRPAASKSGANAETPRDVGATDGASQEAETTPGGECRDDEAVLGSSLSPEDTYRIVKLELSEPALDGQFIQAAALDGDLNGEHHVSAHHTAIFRASHGMKIKVLEEQEGTRVRDVAGRERECAALTRELDRTDRFHVSPCCEGAEPWSWHDRIDVAALALTALGACMVNICNATNLLHSSGDPMFATIRQTLPMTMPLLIGAIGFKALARLFQPGPHRRSYGWTLFIAGLLSWLAWMVCFSGTFSGVLTPVQDLIEQFRANDPANTTASHSGSKLIMLAGGLADAFLAAGAWIICQFIVQSHRLATAIETPEWKEKRRLLNRTLKRRNQARNLLGIVRGELERERNQQAHFISRACRFLRVAAAQNKQLKQLLSSKQ